MDIVGTELGSVGGQFSELRHSAGSADHPGDVGAGAEADGAFGAVAVLRQTASHIALAVGAAPIRDADVGRGPPEQELRDFEQLGFPRLVRLWLKRAFDVLAAAAALIVLSPLLVVIAALIKVSDGGPVLFAQVRVGLQGRTFRMLKFRSMVVHAERLRPRLEVGNESNGPVFKMKLDPRVTPIGKFIRRYSLDELPQLVNVLFGQMSVVGPRPSLPSEVARYEPWQRRRFAVRPGLTCSWQVSPTRYQMSFDDWMYLDLGYVEEWSLRRDFDLILRTFAVVFSGTGH